MIVLKMLRNVFFVGLKNLLLLRLSMMKFLSDAQEIQGDNDNASFFLAETEASATPPWKRWLIFLILCTIICTMMLIPWTELVYFVKMRWFFRQVYVQVYQAEAQHGASTMVGFRCRRTRRRTGPKRTIFSHSTISMNSEMYCTY